jgi:hypothetical protein
MGQNPFVRDPELYYFSVSGSQVPEEAWGLPVVAQHLSLNLTVVGTVWRDFDKDFGQDLIREHYRRASHSHD